MKIILCIDDKGGMLFNKRRQSKDGAVYKDMIQLVQDTKLWMNLYSAKQFNDKPDNVLVDENFLDAASAEDFCFVENVDITPYADKVQCVILYRWNRVYPSDVRFPLGLFEKRWRLQNTKEFSGTSHDRITREVYAL